MDIETTGSREQEASEAIKETVSGKGTADGNDSFTMGIGSDPMDENESAASDFGDDDDDDDNKGKKSKGDALQREHSLEAHAHVS